MNTTETTLDAVVLLERIREFAGRTVRFTSHGEEFRGELVTVLDRGNGVPLDRRLTVILRGNTEAMTGFRTRIAIEFRSAKRQCCRKCLRSCVPAVTLTFRGGTGRLHWCQEHTADADRYRDCESYDRPVVEPVHAFNTDVYAASSAAACGARGWRSGDATVITCPGCKEIVAQRAQTIEQAEAEIAALTNS